MKIFCDEDCIYRNKYAPFCGYCLQKIMESEEKRRGVRQEKNWSFGETGLVWERYGKEAERA